MFLIDCPFCGSRDQREFSCGGEAHIARPPRPASLSDDEWADYLFMRKNPKGVQYERWMHAHGCRRWFNVARNTATDRILAVYRMGEPAPALDGQAPPTPCGEPAVGSGNLALGQGTPAAAKPRVATRPGAPAKPKSAPKPRTSAKPRATARPKSKRPAKAEETTS
ncbi:MAG: sarcosine oxidase subunit delta family protein [Inquilinus sp.]|nr:sarcosine oxidase subunit delta family protein [Inquilinus sp.]